MVVPWKAIPNASITAIISVVIDPLPIPTGYKNWGVQYYYNVLLI